MNVALALWTSADRVQDSRPGVVDRTDTTGYPRFRARAAAVADLLHRVGLVPGGRVAIFMERGADAASAYYGILAAGGVAVVVNETLRPRQVEYILHHSEASWILADRMLLERQPRPIEAPCSIILLDEVPPMGDWAPISRIGSDLAQIIYTSGSTGQPKGVAVSHGNLTAGIRSVTEYLDLKETDRFASLLPFSFDYGQNQLLCSVHLGATLVVERSPLPTRIVRSLREFEVTVLPGVPPLWHQLLGTSDFVERPIPSIRIMTNTGGHLPKEAILSLRAAQPQARLFPMYGLTEAFRSTYLPPEEVDVRPGSIGKAIPGAEIMVLTEDGEPCAPGETGELVHRGPTVALGYWADPEATAKRFRPNPTRPKGTPDAERVVFSGDLVRRDEEGFLYFVGRRDRMIKTLGFRVSPDEVGAALHASGQVLEVVVASEPDVARGESIVAYVVLMKGGSVQALEEFAKIELPRYMQPVRYEVRESLPRTATGKHDVRAVQEVGQHDQA